MPDTSSQTARHTQCSLCSQLADIERGLQVVGREEEDTFVPAIAGNMVFIKSLKPTNSRTLQLQQCSECSTYYLYSTDYEYLATGSEEEQIMTRLTDEEGNKYLEQPTPAEGL